jgi:soluble lytic murein transglycosylase-like protein
LIGISSRLGALLFGTILPVFVLVGQQTTSSLPANNQALATTPVAPVFDPEKAMEEALKKQRASLDKQREAIHRQVLDRAEKVATSVSSLEQFIVPLPMLAAPQPDCPPLNSERVSELISAAAQKQSLDPALLKAVIKQESGFNPCAVSSMGAQGLMQLMPATARELHVTNVFDPVQNVQAGATYLKQMLERYKGDLPLALVGYNAGPARADQGPGATYPLETQNYVASILADLGVDQQDDPTVKEDLAPSEDLEAKLVPKNKDTAPSFSAIVPVEPIKLPTPKP